MTAYVFSGQGAQNTGMGKDLYEFSEAARRVFAMADRIRPGTSAQCFEASKEELGITINTQPCLFAVDLAAARAMDELGFRAEAAAGFSLGEIAALAYTGAMTDEDAFRLVCRRAEYMQEASEKNPGGMMAVLGLDRTAVTEICGRFQRTQPVNFNCPGQIVVSGLPEELEQMLPLVRERGGKGRMLAVSGAFHSDFMTEAADRLGAYLNTVTLHPPRIPLYSNKTGGLYGENAAELIRLQVCHAVQWQRIIENMAAAGTDTFIEVGAGKVLCGLIAKTVPDAGVSHYSEFINQEATGGK